MKMLNNIPFNVTDRFEKDDKIYQIIYIQEKNNMFGKSIVLEIIEIENKNV